MVSAPQPIFRSASLAVPTYTLGGYLNLSFPPTRNIVGDAVLPVSGRLLVLALKGIGKSQLSMQIALEIAAQKSVLGIFDVPERSKTMILQKEIPDWFYQERLLQASGRYAQLDQSKILIPGQDSFMDMYLDTPIGMQTLESTIAFERPNTVILDPWDTFHNQDTSNNQAMRMITNQLDRIRVRYNVAFLVCHHLKKPSNDYRGRRVTQTMFDTLGASAMINWADTVFTMNEMTKEKVHLEPFMRHGREEPPSIIMTRNRRYSGFDAEIQGEPTTTGQFVALAILSKVQRIRRKDLEYEMVKQKIGPKQAQRAVSDMVHKNLCYEIGSNGDRWVINLSPTVRAWYR